MLNIVKVLIIIVVIRRAFNTVYRCSSFWPWSRAKRSMCYENIVHLLVRPSVCLSHSYVILNGWRDWNILFTIP